MVIGCSTLSRNYNLQPPLRFDKGEPKGRTSREYPNLFSGGTRQRTCHSSASNHYPKVILKGRYSDTKPSRKRSHTFARDYRFEWARRHLREEPGRHPLREGKPFLEGGSGPRGGKRFLEQGFSRREARPLEDRFLRID